MIKNLRTLVTGETNPYKNIALEAYLLETVPPETCILYLWQNRHTVVIGRNQNAYKECRIKELEDSGGFLARRLSGGGAVYHDMGNLNFTFIMRNEDYDLAKQSEVILCAVRKLGINAVRTGRNDIETDGRKFSGNAFYKAGGASYHHGTLLVNADKAAAGRFLSVSKAKIQSKGVASVQSRIINLVECNPDITIPALIDALIASFEEVYGEELGVRSREWGAGNMEGEASPCAPAPCGSVATPSAGGTPATPPDIGSREWGVGSGENNLHPGSPHPSPLTPAPSRLKELEAQFSSPEWKYGRNPPFAAEVEGRFAWGGVEVRFDVKGNRIASCEVFSDAMEVAPIEAARAALPGTEFNFEAVRGKLAPVAAEYAEDIARLIFENNA